MNSQVRHVSLQVSKRYEMRDLPNLKAGITNNLTVGMKVVMLTETTGLILLHALILNRELGCEAR